MSKRVLAVGHIGPQHTNDLHKPKVWRSASVLYVSDPKQSWPDYKLGSWEAMTDGEHS